MGPLWGTLLCIFAIATASDPPSVQPSNATTDLSSPSTSPRYFLNSTGAVVFPGISLAPLGAYANITRGQFYSTQSLPGVLAIATPDNANQVAGYFDLISCDPEDYTGSNLSASDVLRLIWDTAPPKEGGVTTIILYSTRSNHCNVTGIDDTRSTVYSVLTTIDPDAAAEVVHNISDSNRDAVAAVTGDPTSYGGSGGSNGNWGTSPTTAIAMIILYAITGIITALFVIIIVTGAIRAHRHPERYGPRTLVGGARQSRAKGIARAMLETLPIVKFGDHQDASKETQPGDIEMSGEQRHGEPDVNSTKDKTVAATVTAVGAAESKPKQPESSDGPITNADGSDATGSLGCSICTEDFQKGEELRVLPCNHKFHPECVDPWLLNVSGTCPLCRVDLRPQSERDESGEGPSSATGDGTIPPPLGMSGTDRRSQAIHDLMLMAYGSREDRIGALRRFRQERRSRSGTITTQEERNNNTTEEGRGLAGRLRDRFRVRTRRHDTNAVGEETVNNETR